jgi:hypothetical protein
MKKTYFILFIYKAYSVHIFCTKIRMSSVPVSAYIHTCTVLVHVDTTQATVAALVLPGTRGTLCTLENQPAVNSSNLHSQKTALNLSRFRAHPC